MYKFIGSVILVGIAFCGYAQDADFKQQARLYYEMGNIYYRDGKYQQAQDQYQKALDLLKQAEAATAKRPAPAAVPQPAVKAAEPAVAPGQESRPRLTEYTIGDDDVLKIGVWQNPDLDQDETIVRPDGMISFPLIGDVPARGLTIPQLDADITRRLSEYVRSPEVSISLVKIGGSKVILLGEVAKPGIYAVTGTKTLLEAIGQAGGFTRDAVPSSVVLVRGGFVNPKAQRLNLSKALQGREFMAQNIVLRAEDIVFVPKKFIANLNYFLTQVIDPLAKGAYVHDTLQNWN